MATGDHAAPFPPGVTPRFLLVYAALFVPFGIMTPYLQVLLEGLGFDLQEIGVIEGALEVMAVVAPPLWGYLSDRTQRPRLALGLAAIGAVPAFMLFRLTNDLLPAVGVAVLFGLFFRPQISLTDGFTFRYIHRHGGDYGVVRIGGSLAFMASVIVLERCNVSGSNALRIIFAGMAIAGFLQFCSVMALPADGPPTAPPPRQTAKEASWRLFLARGFVLFTIAAFLGRMAMTSYYHFFSLFLKERLGFDQVGYIWILGPLSEIPLIFFSGRIMRRIGVKTLFALGLAGIFVRLFCFSFVGHVWQLIPLQLLHALTFGAYHTASVNYVGRLAPLHLKSSAQTMFAAVTMGLGGICGGVLGGWVAKNYGYAALYRGFAMMALAALAILFFVPASEAEPGPDA